MTLTPTEFAHSLEVLDKIGAGTGLWKRCGRPASGGWIHKENGYWLTESDSDDLHWLNGKLSAACWERGWWVSWAEASGSTILSWSVSRPGPAGIMGPENIGGIHPTPAAAMTAALENA